MSPTSPCKVAFYTAASAGSAKAASPRAVRQYTWYVAPATNTLGRRGIAHLKTSDHLSSSYPNKVR